MNRPHLTVLCVLAALALAFASPASAQTTRPVTYMTIPVIGDIGGRVNPVEFSRLLDYAQEKNVSYVILLLDTNRGSYADLASMERAIRTHTTLTLVAFVKDAPDPASRLTRLCTKYFIHVDSDLARLSPSEPHPSTMSDLQQLLGVTQWQRVEMPAVESDKSVELAERVIILPPADPKRVAQEKAAAAEIEARHSLNAASTSSGANGSSATPRSAHTIDVISRWQQESRFKFRLFGKIKNFEDRKLWVIEASLDNQTWSVIHKDVDASGTLEFTLTSDKEPVAIYLKTEGNVVTRWDIHY